MRYMILAMFCPECRAEYRPGFTRCSDCDVDLVHEIPEQDTRVRKRKRDSATMFPTFRNMYREGGRTVQWWTSYRHQAGAWPWFSIVIHFMNWVVILIGGGFLIWWTVEHHLSRWQFFGIFLLVSLPYTILENWAKRKVKLSYLRNSRKRIQMPRNKRKSAYWVRSALVFVMHQIIGTEGVVWLTTLGVFLLRSSVREVHEPWGDSALMRGMHLISTNTPFFPIQIAVGAYLGWKLYLRWVHRSMLWVWILPGALLIYAVIAIPTFSPWSTSPETGPLSHYFGWGCQADFRCYDQLTFTQPFYTSVAYSLGALWASRRLRSPRYVKDRQHDLKENRGGQEERRSA